MPNIFFFDIDNTLLDHSTLSIPPSALDAIAGLRQEGHTVAIATGRAYAHAKQFIDQVHPSYAITQNGARILRGEEVVYSEPLPRTRLGELFDWMNELGHAWGVEDGTVAYLNELTPMTTQPFETVGISYHSGPPIHRDQDSYQSWLFIDESLDTTLLPELRARFPEFEFVRWHRWAVDVTLRTINKWTGCQWVMARTGFTPEQAIAFGDGLNDIQMLQGVGLGIAMGNAHPDLKAVADHIAPTLQLDGIARALEELVASNKL